MYVKYPDVPNTPRLTVTNVSSMASDESEKHNRPKGISRYLRTRDDFSCAVRQIVSLLFGTVKFVLTLS
jgi:hypothetical protein